MATQTPNYNFNLPEDGADNDVWGGFLNDNWSSADTIFDFLQTTINELRAQTQVPIGGLYLSSDDDDPATKLGYGAWEAFAEGRALVGVGTAAGEVGGFAAGEEKGANNHVLTTSEIPPHTHNIAVPQVDVSEDIHSHRVYYENKGVGDGSQDTVGSQNSNDGDKAGTDEYTHNHVISIPDFDSDAAGGGEGHTSLQPSIGIYVWKRIS